MEHIKKFKEECAHFPLQYTPEWFARIDSIGGSEFEKMRAAPLKHAAEKLANSIPFKTQPAPPAAAPQTSTDADDVEIIGAPQVKASAPQAKTGAQVHSMDDVEIIGACDSCVATSLPSETLAAASAAAQSPPQFGQFTDSFMAFNCGWGTLFEPLLTNYIARTLSLRILCRSLSYFNGSFRYSPDGLFVDEEGKVGLLEMKNPSMKGSSIVTAEKNDFLVAPHLQKGVIGADIKAEYKSQMQLGLDLLRFTSYAFFVEGFFRKTNQYGIASGVNKQQMRMREAKSLADGIIAFYHSSGRGTLESAYNFAFFKNDDFLIRAIENMRSSDPFIPLYFKGAGTDASDHEEQDAIFREVFTTKEELPLTHPQNGLPLFGFMPWRLLGVRSARVERDPCFVSEADRRNANFVASFIHANMHKTPEEKIQALGELRDIAARTGSPQLIDIERQLEIAKKRIAS